MASTKRELPTSDEPEFKKPKISVLEPSQHTAISNARVVLNSADCDIEFNVEGDGLLGSALYEEGFAYCWSGARANTGITGGKYCFGCKIVSSQPVDMEDTPLDSQHVCRIGISRGDDAVRNLGETSNSFGFGGTGKFSTSGIFSDYGVKFGVGDTIVCAVDLESCPMASIGFSKNGKWLGVAKHFDAGPNGLGVVGSPLGNLAWKSAIFPHVLLKNVEVQLQFSVDDCLVPQQGYKPWADAFLDGNSIIGPGFSNENEREVIMMVGLPASGKTTWAEKWVNEHPEKRYVLLGTNLALEQMKVPGLLRKNNYGERFDRLMGYATKIVNVLLSRASKISRNFIIDQTNVYKSARKRKLKPFANYHKTAVVVFPKVEELKSRAEKRFQEMGKAVPAEAVNEMLANYTLPMSKDMPRTDEDFDQVWFVELSREEAQRSLDEMKREVSVKSSYSQRSQNAPIQSNTAESLQNQDPYRTPISGLPHGFFTNDAWYGRAYSQPPPPRPPYVNTPMDMPLPYGIVPSYMQNVGQISSRRPPYVNSPMDVHPHCGNFHGHVQSGFPPCPLRPTLPLPHPLIQPQPQPTHSRPPLPALPPLIPPSPPLSPLSPHSPLPPWPTPPPPTMGVLRTIPEYTPFPPGASNWHS